MSWFGGSLGNVLGNEEEVIESIDVNDGVIDQGSERWVVNSSVVNGEEFLWWEFFNDNDGKFWFIVGIEVRERF